MAVFRQATAQRRSVRHCARTASYAASASSDASMATSSAQQLSQTSPWTTVGLTRKQSALTVHARGQINGSNDRGAGGGDPASDAGASSPLDEHATTVRTSASAPAGPLTTHAFFASSVILATNMQSTTLAPRYTVRSREPST